MTILDHYLYVHLDQMITISRLKQTHVVPYMRVHVDVVRVAQMSTCVVAQISTCVVAQMSTV